MAKAGKGSVVIQAPGGRLRLVWTFNRERYFMALGLPDNPVARLAATEKATLIEKDLFSGNFDKTLAKYKLPQSSQRDRISVVAVFKLFIEYKAKTVDLDTLINYRALLVHLTAFFKERSFGAITEVEAFAFRDWMLKKIEARTLQGHLALINACWKWRIKKEKLTIDNPWADVRVAVPPKQKPKLFSRKEIDLILEGFERHPTHNHYHDFVVFIFGTGARTGEARGLLWKHLSDDCRSIWIGQAASRGRRKAPKMNKDRTFTLTPRLQQMFLARRPKDYDPEGIVFPAPEGGLMDAKNFCNRAWKEVLASQGVPYNRPYHSVSVMNFSPLVREKLIG